MAVFNRANFQKVLKREKSLHHEIFMYQRIMEAMRRGLKFESLLKLFVGAVRKGLGFKRAGIFFREPDGKHVYLAMGTDAKGNFEKNKDRISLTTRRGEIPLSDIVNGYKKYFLSNNIPRRIPDRTKYRVEVLNNAIVPIEIGKGRIIGALAVDNLYAHQPISRSDVSNLMNYATQVGLALESFKTHERILQQAITDPLTGLYNRRFFEKTLSQELSRCQRYKRACSLILVDIDHFKKVNDTYGHDAGDRIIEQVAGLLRSHLRGLDVVARVGGEEFAILLPETPPQNIMVVVRRLLATVRAARPVVPKMAADKRGMRFSLGLSTYRQGPVTAAKLMKLADLSLYQAKRRGRDRSGPLMTFNT